MDPVIDEEVYQHWDRKKDRITDIITLPPEVPVHENRPNKDNIPVSNGVAIIEPRKNTDGELVRDDKGKYVMDIIGG